MSSFSPRIAPSLIVISSHMLSFGHSLNCDVSPLPKYKGEQHYDDTFRDDGGCGLLPVFTQFIRTNVFQVRT